MQQERGTPNDVPRKSAVRPERDRPKVASLNTELALELETMERNQCEQTLKWLRTYDPRDEEGFKLIMRRSVNIIGETERIAKLLDVTVSTLNRWISGSAKPIKMARMGTALILEALLTEKLTGESLDIEQLHKRFSHQLELLKAQDKKLSHLDNGVSAVVTAEPDKVLSEAP